MNTCSETCLKRPLNSFRMAVVYVLMFFKCKICFTVYTGETKINDTYLLTYSK